MRARNALLLVGLVALVGGVGAWRLASAGSEDSMTASEASRVRSWARSETAAGVSVLPKRVPAVDRGALKSLESLPGFHEYAMRCSSCHVLPDPGAYPASRWAGKVGEMREHIGRAGVMPPTEEELKAAVGFLEAASEALRGH